MYVAHSNYETEELSRLLKVKISAKEQADSLFINEKIEKGLPFNALPSVVQEMAPHDPSIKYSIVSKATYDRRRKSGKLTLVEGDTVSELAYLWIHAKRVLGSLERAQLFFNAPHPFLKGKKPLDLIQTATGRRLIEAVLGRLEFGSAA